MIFGAACLLGTVQHFLYEPLGRPAALRWLLPTSESPWETVRARGEFSIYQLVVDGVLQPDPVAYACIIADAAACCAEGMEFVLKDNLAYPDDYPEPGAEITVVGEFQAYEENGMTGYHLINARLESSEMRYT